MFKSRPNIIIATIGILVAVLVCVQAAWLYNVNTKNKEATALRTKQAVNNAGKQIETSINCVELFTKYHVAEGEGFYLSKQNWDESGYYGHADSIDMYYDFTEFRGDAKADDIPYKYSTFKATYPADIEVLFRIHFLPGKRSSAFDSVAGSISRSNFKEIISASNKLEDLIKPDKIETIITTHLQNEGLDISFDYALVALKDTTIVAGSDIQDTTYFFANGIATILFNNDKFIPDYQLIVLSHNNSSLYTVSSLMLLSIIIILLLTYAFYVFARLYKNQAKISEMKTDFINNLTHEFNTPMANISLALETIDEHEITTNNKLKNILDIISVESDRLRDNIERALHVATLEKDSLNLRNETVDINELVTTIEPSYTLQCKQYGGYLNITQSGNCLVKGDETHLLNCICNLLDNAIKYRKDKPVINLDVKEADNTVLIIVEDNGIGMSKETQQKIFDLFFRAHEGDVHNTKGFGLGLTYVKGIVEASAGTISVQSTEGKGSVFTIKLPKTKN